MQAQVVHPADIASPAVKTGLVASALSGSSLIVCGPAAGLAPSVPLGIPQVGGFEPLLPAVVPAGGLQVLLGAIRAGTVAYDVPSSVIKDMLAGIGITLILEHLPHAVGYDRDAEGDMAFSEWWPRSPSARVRLLPAPLFAVGAGVAVNELLRVYLQVLRRDAPVNRELIAQAAGNMLAGLLGTLPIAGVIIGSSANVDAGARWGVAVMVHAAPGGRSPADRPPLLWLGTT